ncbi:MAG TPA: type II toxin-antitoxin system PemK/MazF family toxin [Acidimicrobiales bacterium]|nr:type II toxin-antitoxin system PemK/MazF family toxin [Acidimicrobiales bacterium]
MAEFPHRGELWLVAFGASRAGEPGKTRPAIVASTDALPAGEPTDLVVVIPVSSSRAPSKLRIELGTEAGVERPSRAIPQAIRSVSASRLIRRIGSVDTSAMSEIMFALSVILELDAEP